MLEKDVPRKKIGMNPINLKNNVSFVSCSLNVLLCICHVIPENCAECYHFRLGHLFYPIFPQVMLRLGHWLPASVNEFEKYIANYCNTSINWRKYLEFQLGIRKFPGIDFTVTQCIRWIIHGSSVRFTSEGRAGIGDICIRHIGTQNIVMDDIQQEESD